MNIIFLDIDGVILNPYIEIPKYLQEQYAKHNKPLPDGCFTSEECNKAAVDLFDKTALKHLDDLIESFEKNGQPVRIVITSAWAYGKTLEQLRKLFKQHKFSTKIIDKIADNAYIIHNDCYISLSRAEKIEIWLQACHCKKYQINNFIIFDDVDACLTELFGDHFIKTTKLITEQDVMKAYKKLQQPSSLAHAKADNFVNKLNIRMTFEEKDIESENFIRVTSDSRKYFIKNLFKNENGFFATNDLTNRDRYSVTELIAEYDSGLKKRYC